MLASYVPTVNTTRLALIPYHICAMSSFPFFLFSCFASHAFPSLLIICVLSSLASGEMLCPLCKSLVNTLVPHVPTAAAKLLTRRPITATTPPTPTSLSTTTTAATTMSLSSLLASPFVPQDWYLRIKQYQLQLDTTSSSESIDVNNNSKPSASTANPANAALQRYFAQANIAACVSTFDQALQALCGTTPPLPTGVESSPLRSFHRLCGSVAYTVQSACLAKSWGRVGRTATATAALATTASSSSSKDGSPAIAPRCGVLSKETDAKEVAFLSQLLFGLLLSVRQQVEQQGKLEKLYARNDDSDSDDQVPTGAAGSTKAD